MDMYDAILRENINDAKGKRDSGLLRMYIKEIENEEIRFEYFNECVSYLTNYDKGQIIETFTNEEYKAKAVRELSNKDGIVDERTVVDMAKDFKDVSNMVKAFSCLQTNSYRWELANIIKDDGFVEAAKAGCNPRYFISFIKSIDKKVEILLAIKNPEEREKIINSEFNKFEQKEIREKLDEAVTRNSRETNLESMTIEELQKEVDSGEQEIAENSDKISKLEEEKRKMLMDRVKKQREVKASQKERIGELESELALLKQDGRVNTNEIQPGD